MIPDISDSSLEHIGIAVKDLSVSIPLFEKLLNTQCYKQEVVEKEKVSTAFFQPGSSKIELLESKSADSPIAKFIAKRGEGLHHIAFEVDNLEQEIQRLQQLGFTFINPEPSPGADNKMVCFLHPKSTNGVLVELVMERK